MTAHLAPDAAWVARIARRVPLPRIAPAEEAAVRDLPQRRGGASYATRQGIAAAGGTTVV